MRRAKILQNTNQDGQKETHHTEGDNGFKGYIKSIHGQIVLIEHKGNPIPKLHEVLTTPETRNVKMEVYAHVDQYLMYCLSLTPVDNLTRGTELISTGKPITVPVGKELLGRVINLTGDPLDGLGELKSIKERSIYTDTLSYEGVTSDNTLLETGIKQIDFFTPFLRGGKIGMIGGAGVGKTILLTEIIRNLLSTHEGIAIFAGIGERIREGHELHLSLKNSGVLNKTALIFGQMNENAVVRFLTAWSATSLAEYFRDEEKKDVLFFVDNVYRFIQAGSELSTLIEQIPSELGYQPTLETEIASFESRLSSTKDAFITSVQNIYVPADEISDPGVKAIMAYLDASVVLSRNRASLGMYPPIDIFLSSSNSLSRKILGTKHFEVASEALQLLNEYERLSRIVAVIGEQELSVDNQTIFKRGKLLLYYMTQPFFVTENQTGRKGVYVKRADVISDVTTLLEGKYDATPPDHLLYIGTIKESASAKITIQQMTNDKKATNNENTISPQQAKKSSTSKDK